MSQTFNIINKVSNESIWYGQTYRDQNGEHKCSIIKNQLIVLEKFIDSNNIKDLIDDCDGYDVENYREENGIFYEKTNEEEEIHSLLGCNYLIGGINNPLAKYLEVNVSEAEEKRIKEKLLKYNFPYLSSCIKEQSCLD